ncbi:protein kinase domain-containing protein [Streptomyces griseiscabiei]|uniref:protein kinase domain-containing protein n=1 Tax=Streptomyces griseiscabiei TaxID=2993540 RepID=UPI0015C506D8|nr:protein kinase [Streptomyces griseiscabiei]MBZ3906477.1 protein kinase [Streptomyces griseiscabiei]
MTDRYRLEEQLGSGGMGAVWRGLDLQLERPVAIKLLRPGPFPDKEALARFRREGKAAARLSRPAIAAVHDVSTHQGQPFLVLELLDGHNLETVLNRTPQGLATDQVLRSGSYALLHQVDRKPRGHRPRPSPRPDRAFPDRMTDHDLVRHPASAIRQRRTTLDRSLDGPDTNIPTSEPSDWVSRVTVCPPWLTGRRCGARARMQLRGPELSVHGQSDSEQDDRVDPR